MAKQGKQRSASKARDRAAAAAPPANPLTSFPADPPRRHRWFLIASSLGVVGWMLFLLAMGLRG
jgi:hypothetical protein